MPDANSVIGVLGVLSAVLGNLNKTHPGNDFEALKVIDENDPVRLSLQAFLDDGTPPLPGTCIQLTDGTTLGLRQVLELGFGAARLQIGNPVDSRYTHPSDFLCDNRHWPNDLHWTHAVIRYREIRCVLEPA